MLSYQNVPKHKNYSSTVGAYLTRTESKPEPDDAQYAADKVRKGLDTMKQKMDEMKKKKEEAE